jgi:beta-glucanase (GH16 family)
MRLCVTAVCALMTAGCGSGASQPATSPSPPQTAAWADEFDGAANAAPDASKWTYDLGGGGWGNQELETYTSASDNVHLDGQGHLVIRVLSAGGTYSSARLKTQGRFTAQYGHLEARIKLPVGRGIWPAFWMLGASITTAGWPACGEIDIMENIGSQPSVNHGSAHGPGYSGGNAITATYGLPGGARFTDDFHTFAIDWTPGRIAFLVDGATYHTVDRARIPAGTPWVFDAPFFLLLNVAVGGTFPGPPDATTSFPQEMIVDYVRYVPGA